jgi:hypothetical protein
VVKSTMMMMIIIKEDNLKSQLKTGLRIGITQRKKKQSKLKKMRKGNSSTAKN